VTRKIIEAERAYTIEEAATLKGVSKDTIRKAIRASRGNVLRAKNISTSSHPRYRIPATALDAWFDGLADA
jgi:hypothetical protein